METMSVEQLLTQMRAVMTDNEGPTQSKVRNDGRRFACYRCGGPNHMVKDFLQYFVGKIVTYLTSMWARFVGFIRLTKKKLKWQHTVAFVFDYLVWVTQTLAIPMQMRLCQVYKNSHGVNRRVSLKKACCVGRHVQQIDCLSQ